MHLLIIPQLLQMLGVLLLFFMSSNIGFAQTKDNYLQLLEGEASQLTLDNKTKAKNIESSAKKILGLSNNYLPAGLSLEMLLQHLKINYIGTYFFAKRLSIAGQKELYEFYKSNNDPQAIRTQIIKISKHGKTP